MCLRLTVREAINSKSIKKIGSALTLSSKQLSEASSGAAIREVDKISSNSSFMWKELGSRYRTVYSV